MGRVRLALLIVLLISVLTIFKVDSYNVDITYVESAVAEGAVCLDGSPPAYHFSPGFGAGVDNWLVHFEGGAWCNNVTTCLARRDTRLGSSKAMDKQKSFSGILSNKQQSNPDFFNWNKVYVRYCDGSSFTGDVDAVNPATKLYYRGARVFVAVVDDLKTKGMSHASYALLSGCSAGGLTAILNCDKFRSLMPATTKVKCLADAGYFINVKDISGAQHIQDLYNDVVNTHQSAKNLPSYCTSKMSPGLCFFPENIALQIQTPLFLLNAAYDSYQIKNSLAPGVADPHGTWHDCKTDIKLCSSQQIGTMQGNLYNGMTWHRLIIKEEILTNVKPTTMGAAFVCMSSLIKDIKIISEFSGFRQNFLTALSKSGTASSRGMFINSCYAHCQTGTQETWLANGSPVLDKTSIAKAIGDWYFDRNPFQTIDCPYPCDSTCHNRVFED